jgi:hypothetical protein
MGLLNQIHAQFHPQPTSVQHQLFRTNPNHSHTIKLFFLHPHFLWDVAFDFFIIFLLARLDPLCSTEIYKRKMPPIR